MATIDPLTGLPSSNTPQAISASSLSPQTPLTVSTPTPDTTDYSGIITPVTNQIAGDLANLTARTNEQQGATNKKAQERLDLMGLLSGKTADTQLANETTGVNTEIANLNKYTEQLAGLNASASSLNREAQAIPIQVQQASQGRGRTDAGVAPLATAQLRDNALKALSIGQQADIAAAAATGSQLRLNAAKEKAQQVVDLKYKPLEEQLAIRKQQYELNKDILSSIDKKRTESLNAAIKREETALAEKKANEKAVSDLVVNASSQGAPTDIVSRAAKAKTEAEAAQILGAYSGDYWGTKLKIAQISKAQSESAKIRSEIATAGTGSSSTVSSQDQAKFLLDTISQATNLSKASGRSAARRGTEAFLVGATDYTNLESKVRTVKNNLLTLATDPNIKKFFGPQMTESDVKNMLAAASTLDTEGQTPQELKDELERVQGIFQKFVPDYKPQVEPKQTPQTWAETIKSSLLTPTQGSNYGYQDKR